MKRYFLPKLLAVAIAATAATSSLAGQAILNLKDADIRVVIEQISKLTGKTFVLDPRVQGQKITILSQHMMDEREIYDTFLTILKINGFAAVQTGQVIKIVQEQSARQDSVAVYKEGRRYGGDELITRVIKVEHVDATQMVPVIRTLVPQQGHLAQYPRTNVIIIHDTYANIERIVEIIRQIDKASEAEVEIVALKHASADEVVRIMDALDKGGKPEDTVNKPQIAADVRTNSILVRAEGPARLKIRAMIAQLDTPVSSGGNTQVIYLKYAKAEDMVKVLTGVSKQIEKEDNKKEGASAAGGGRRNDNYSIDAHPETNTVVISAPPDMMRSLEAVIRQLDIRRAQVHVEAIIVEVSDELGKQLGVQWLFGGSQDGSTAPIGFSNFTNTGAGITSIAGAAAAQQGTTTGSTVTTTSSDGVVTKTEPGNNGDGGKALASVLGSMQGIGLGLAKIRDSGFSFAAFIQALGTTTDSNVLATPSLTTLDNQEAMFLDGQEIPIITGSTLGGNNQNPFQQVQRQEVGIKLKLKPQINEGTSIKLDIDQEISGVAGTTGVDIVTNKRQIKNSVLVEDGATIVLGGIIKEDVQESVSKVPILGDIPLLGHLFKSQSSKKRKTHVMVFIKPTIMRGEQEQVISSAKYNALRARQLQAREDGINLMPFEDKPVLPELHNSSFNNHALPATVPSLLDAPAPATQSLLEATPPPAPTPLIPTHDSPAATVENGEKQ